MAAHLGCDSTVSGDIRVKVSFQVLGEPGHTPYLGVGTDTASFTFSSINFVYDDGNQPLLKVKIKKKTHL